MGKWKLVSTAARRSPYKGQWELYDLQTDRSETNDLAEQYPDIVAQMDQLWEKWAEANHVNPIDGRGWNQKINASIR
jgi:arylsulfatase